MDQNFERALKFVLDHEGGYVNDPRDPGKETNFGISKKSYPELDIKALTVEQAKEIYLRDYWQRTGCGSIAQPLDIVVFDTAVNCGVARARDWLQKSHRVADYLIRRMGFYVQLVRANPANKRFLAGWIRRCVELWEEVRDETA